MTLVVTHWLAEGYHAADDGNRKIFEGFSFVGYGDEDIEILKVMRKVARVSVLRKRMGEYFTREFIS